MTNRTFIVCMPAEGAGNLVGRLYEMVPSRISANFLTSLNYYYRPYPGIDAVILNQAGSVEELAMTIDMVCPDCRKLVSADIVNSYLPWRLVYAVQNGFTISALDSITYFKEIGRGA